MSMLNDILDRVVTIQNGLGLTLDGHVLTAVKRALPKREEQVDLSFQVTVSGQEQVDECTRIGFGGKWRVVYSVDVTLITPNDRDMLKHLPEHTDWREATRATYMATNPLALPGVKGVEVVRSPMLMRSKLAKGYNYNQVSLIVTTYESR